MTADAQKGEAMFAPTNTASANNPTPSKVRIHTVNDIATPATRAAAKAKRDRKTPSAEAAFVCGRDLAVAMIREGEARWNTDLSEPRRNTRLGVGFDNFSRAHLQVLIDRPELLDGFAAVMSAKCGVGDLLLAADFQLPQAEYEAGQPGADGTQRGDEVGPRSDEARVCDSIVNPPRDTAQKVSATERAGEDASRALLNGYNACQIATVHEAIATRASSLGECLRDLRDDPDTPPSNPLYWSLNGAADMADMIGLLADAVTGGSIKGDATAWLIGPLFANEGKAVCA